MFYFILKIVHYYICKSDLSLLYLCSIKYFALKSIDRPIRRVFFVCCLVTSRQIHLQLDLTGHHQRRRVSLSWGECYQHLVEMVTHEPTKASISFTRQVTAVDGCSHTPRDCTTLMSLFLSVSHFPTPPPPYVSRSSLFILRLSLCVSERGTWFWCDFATYFHLKMKEIDEFKCY